MAVKNTKYQDSLLSVSKVPIYAKQATSINQDLQMDGTEQHHYEELSSLKSKEAREAAGKTNIVIHVCDETKNVKQDFTCPRDLLISEMKYFADYLSTESDKWEDVDISVHCDVHIFDWLIRYVKQGVESSDEKPKLEHSNVISILISSDFLKMETLVEECIYYCYRNMTKIISTPCNMNCINDKLVTRIAKLFTHREVEAIQDKKDKFKSKLFCKKFEELFNPSFGNEDCPSNASTLFKCTFCEKLLIWRFRSKIECIGDRTVIDSRGNLSYSHSRDSNWDVNDYLLYLKSNLKTWRNVYWRIWGTINYLYCSRCEEIFPCTEYGSCSFHPQQGVFTDDANLTKRTGHFPCCNAMAIKFNPINKIKGCTFRDHLIEFPDGPSASLSQENSGMHLNSRLVVDQLLANKDVICVPAKQSKFKNDGVFVTSILNPAKMAPPHITTSNNAKYLESKQMGGCEVKSSSTRVRRNRIKNYEDEDQSDSEDNAIVRVIINPTKRNKTNSDDKTNSTWDTSLPIRLNQDLQREDDLRRMNELMLALLRNRRDENQKGELDKNGDSSQESPTPGTYHRIEQQLRSSISSSRSQSAANASSSTGSRPARVSSVK